MVCRFDRRAGPAARRALTSRRREPTSSKAPPSEEGPERYGRGPRPAAAPQLSARAPAPGLVGRSLELAELRAAYDSLGPGGGAGVTGRTPHDWWAYRNGGLIAVDLDITNCRDRR